MDLSHISFEGSDAKAGQLRSRQRDGRAPVVFSTESNEPCVSGLPAYVLEHNGLDPSIYRRRPLERRIGACLRALREDSEIHARARLTNPDARAVALNTLLIGVSGFFRDAAVFETIRTIVVPALRARQRPVRVLSVGCSSGAELYSVAILMSESGLLEDAELLGMDCRPDAVSLARRAVFDHDALAGVDRTIRDSCFERIAAGWRIRESSRTRARWQVADATTELPPGEWDLVLCRNVVIYLRPLAGEALFRRIAGALAPGGFLVVGKAERPPRLPELIPVGRCTYRNDRAL